MLKDTDHVSDSRVGEVGALQVSKDLKRRPPHHHPGLVEGLDLRKEQMCPSCHELAEPSCSQPGAIPAWRLPTPPLCPLCPAAPTGLVKSRSPLVKGPPCPSCAWKGFSGSAVPCCSHRLGVGDWPVHESQVSDLDMHRQGICSSLRQLLRERSPAQLHLPHHTNQETRFFCYFMRQPVPHRNTAMENISVIHCVLGC